MTETWVELKRGGSINTRYIRQSGFSRSGGWSAIDDKGSAWDLNEDPTDMDAVFVAGSGVAHSFWDWAPRGTEPTLDHIGTTRTTVVAWKINPRHPNWPTPILLDATDAENDSALLTVVEDHGKFQDIGMTTYESLEAAREDALTTARRKWQIEQSTEEKRTRTANATVPKN